MKTLQQPIVRFLLFFAGLYVLWFLVYDLWLHPEESLDEWIIQWTIYISEHVLQLFGYTIYTDGGRVIAVAGTSGLYVGDSCNSITLVALFSGFIIAWPGIIKRKIIYILLGSFFIFTLNVIRIMVLCILETYSRAYTEFNHTYTFTFLMYAFIFLLWYLWVEKYSGIKTSEKKDAEK